MPLTQVPTVEAMVVADEIYTDAQTGKRIICGTFSQIHVVKIPGIFGKFSYAFILLTDGMGDGMLCLRFVHLQTNKVLLQSPSMNFQFDDPLRVHDIVIKLPPFPLVTEGFYNLECWVDDNLIGSVRLHASARDSQ